MPDAPRQPALFDPDLLAHVACPACHGELRTAEGGLTCAACGRIYPVVDGIPVLIAERAEIPGQSA